MKRKTQQSHPNRGNIALRLALPVLGLLMVIAAMVFAFVAQDFTGWRFYLAAGGFAMFLSIFLTWEKGNLLNYIHLGIYCVFVVASLLLIAMIASQRPKSWDLTQDKLHSLTGQTKQYLKSLPQPVKIVAFVQNSQKTQAERFLKHYSEQNPGMVITEVYDPIQDKYIAQSYDQNIYPPTYYVIREDASGAKKQKKLTLAEGSREIESQVTNAIIEVMRDQETKLYFLQGHAERPFVQPENVTADAPDESISELIRLLEERAFRCAPLNLLERGGVPEDCSVLAIAGPQTDLFEIEKDMILDYLDEGGKCVILFDPIYQPDVKTPNMHALLQNYGVETPPNSVVIDYLAAQVTHPLMPYLHEFGNHVIVEGMQPGAMYFLESRPLTKTQSPPPGLFMTDLFKTNSQTWSVDMKEIRESGEKLRQTEDNLKSQTLAMVVTKKDAGLRGDTRLVVMGDSDVFTNTAINNLSAILFLQTCNWLAEQEDLLAIPPKVLSETSLNLTQANLMILGLSLLVLVIVVLGGGLSYTVLRRRLG